MAGSETDWQNLIEGINKVANEAKVTTRWAIVTALFAILTFIASVILIIIN